MIMFMLCGYKAECECGFELLLQKKNGSNVGGGHGVFGDVYVMIPKEIGMGKVDKFDERFQLPDFRHVVRVSYFFLLIYIGQKISFFFKKNVINKGLSVDSF